MMVSEIATTRLADQVTTTHAAGVQEVTSREEIARLAYQLYELRGRQDGHDVGDWLAAEEELLRQADAAQRDDIAQHHWAD